MLVITFKDDELNQVHRDDFRVDNCRTTSNITSMARRPRDDRFEVLVRCARLFYEQHLSKTQIAKQLGVSAMHVKRLLDEANSRRIVRISIVERRDLVEIEESLAKKFSLKIVRVAPYSSDYERQKDALGLVAARLFDELVTVRTLVGVGGGGSLKAMIDALETHPREIDIAPMALVGRGSTLEYVDAAFLASLLFYKSSPKARASVIGMLPPPEEKGDRRRFIELVMSTVPEIDTVLDRARNSAVAFIGLGGPEPVPELTPVLRRAGLSERELTRQHAAGGINYNYFDGQGREVATFFKTLQINDLRQMTATGKTVIVVAGGAHKEAAIRIALRTGMANGLVTDERTALQLKDTPSGTD